MSGLLDLDIVQDVAVDEVEVGCAVYSLTRVNAFGGPVGGVVVGQTPDEDGFEILRFDRDGPYMDAVVFDDVDCAVTDLHGKIARDTSAQLHAWLGAQKRMDARDKAKWSTVANQLDQVALTGVWLPRADARYRAAVEARKQERNES